MAIYSRFGEVVDSVRYATLADVKRLDKLDDEARVCLGNRSWVVVEGPEVPESVSHLAYLRADDGLKEIIGALVGKEWECPYCTERYVERGENNRCDKATCHKKHEATDKRMRRARGW